MGQPFPPTGIRKTGRDGPRARWGSTRHGVLAWRYQNHPDFTYRILTVREGKRTGLAVWRLETITVLPRKGASQWIALAVSWEFLPASHANAEALLACFWQALRKRTLSVPITTAITVALAPGCTKQVSTRCSTVLMAGWLCQPVFSRWTAKAGASLVLFFAPNDVPACTAAAECPWYWTKSDADQDRPN